MRIPMSLCLAGLLAWLVPAILHHRGGAAPITQGRQAESPADTISGIVTVIAEGNERARRDVTVELIREGSIVATATTDRLGWFTFDRLAPGVYVVRATLPGHLPVESRVVVTTDPRPLVRLVLGAPAAEEGDAEAAAVPATGQILYRALPEIARSTILAPMARVRSPADPFNTATYDRIEDNSFQRVLDQPLSTFSIDVDTASYSNVRRFLNQGALPPADAVRIEELINYFRFDYPDPQGDAPFSLVTEVSVCPWNARHRLALVGLQTKRDRRREAPPRNLVFLLDVSGSMQPSNRLPLIRTAMRMLVDTLTTRDRVAIVVYAGATGVVLPSTPGDRRPEIHDAIARLQAGGPTNGAAGIQLAYDTAAAQMIQGGVNRVILATDGDFNVGVTSQGELIRLIERQRERGIYLSVLGVGDNNLKDSTMEKLADKGNGNYAYLDSLHEAHRVLVAEAGSTLLTVAKDVKIQVEFNPRHVEAYRLVGYENRLLQSQDFNDDRKDAGEIGAGKAVTALYEIIPPGEPVPGGTVDSLKYQQQGRPSAASRSTELMTVKLRYKTPEETSSRLLTHPVAHVSSVLTSRIGFAAAVAQFGMLLRESEFRGESTWRSTRALAREHRGEDGDGYRAEFIRLVDLAAALQAQRTGN